MLENPRSGSSFRPFRPCAYRDPPSLVELEARVVHEVLLGEPEACAGSPFEEGGGSPGSQIRHLLFEIHYL